MPGIQLIPVLPVCLPCDGKPKTGCVEPTHEQTLRHPLLASPSHPDVRHQRLPVPDPPPGEDTDRSGLPTTRPATGHRPSPKRSALRPRAWNTRSPRPCSSFRRTSISRRCSSGLHRTTDLGEQRVYLVTGDRSAISCDRSKGLRSEEEQFVERYRPLFTGRVSWQSARDPCTSRSPGHPLRDEWQPPHVAQPSYPGKAGRFPPKTGDWIPWFADNKQSILGWVQRRPDDIIYGAELDLTALLYWLINYFPDTAPEGMEYALLDGRGESLYQTGVGRIESGSKPIVTVPLAPYLPHWQVATYVLDSPLTARSGQRFFLLSVLLLSIFVAAIILGGSLLTWQAHRNMTSAQQKTSFVSNVSHELKTPLTSIRMFAELLQEDRIKDPSKKAHYLKVIVAESQRLTRLVNNVLDFSRLEQGRKQYHLKELEISGYLRYIVETQRLRVQEAGMVLDNQIPEDGVQSPVGRGCRRAGASQPAGQRDQVRGRRRRS